MTSGQTKWIRETVDWPPPRLVLDARDTLAEQLGDDRVVRPQGRVTYRVEGPSLGPAFQDRIEFEVARTPAGLDLWNGAVCVGRRRTLAGVLGPGTYRVCAENDLYESAVRDDVVVGPEDQSAIPQVYRFDLLSRVSPPRGAGRIELRGVLRDVDGTAAAGWPVAASGWDPVISDDQGAWVLRPNPPFLASSRPTEVDVSFGAFGTSLPATIPVKVRPGVPELVSQSALYGRTVGKLSGVGGLRVVAEPVDLPPRFAFDVRSDVSGRWAAYLPMDWPGGWFSVAARLQGAEAGPHRVEVPRRKQVRVPDLSFPGEE